MRQIKEIIIHCSDSPEGRNDTANDIRSWHKKRGFNDIGYHYVILLDGTIEVGRAEDQIGAHCSNHNANSIGICYIGGAEWRDGVDEKGKPIKGKDGKTMLIPKDTRTVAQYNAMTQLLRDLKKKYPKATIHGHCQFANKACPSFDVPKYLKQIGLALMTLMLIVLTPSCATPKHTADSHIDTTENKVEEQQQAGAEQVTQQHMDAQTDVQQHTDSTTTSKTNLVVEFTFVPGGGTMNTKTGDVSGVASAKLQADIEHLQHTIRDQDTQIHVLRDSLTAARDSLNTYRNQSNLQLSEDTHEEQDAPSKPFGWRFCITCTVLFWLIIAYYIARIVIKIYTHGRL